MRAALTPPNGIRDLLPPESVARRRVSATLQEAFERYGYQLVTTPLFEDVEVFERSPGGDPRALLRFVEPDTGSVAALRPDITPQVARVVATRMRHQPGPWRIRYEGRIIRRRRGRARKQRQVAQVGVELIGLAGAEADAEVITLAAEACEDVGLQRFQIELSPVSVASALLQDAGVQDLDRAAEALARKDERELEAALRAASVTGRERKRIMALAELYGDVSVLERARRLLRDTKAARGLTRLEAVVRKLEAAGLRDRLGVDFGELRGHTYYTGLSFSLLADGPGEAVASGGRYDQLLGLYGYPQPATGVAVDLENLLWALGAAPTERGQRPSLAVSGTGAAALRAAALLREQGFAAAVLPKQPLRHARRYAEAWGLDGAVLATGATIEVARVGGNRKRSAHLSNATELQALKAWLHEPEG